MRDIEADMHLRDFLQHVALRWEISGRPRAISALARVMSQSVVEPLATCTSRCRLHLQTTNCQATPDTFLKSSTRLSNVTLPRRMLRGLGSQVVLALGLVVVLTSIIDSSQLQLKLVRQQLLQNHAAEK